MKPIQKTIVFFILCFLSTGAFSNEMAAREEIKANVKFLFMNEKFKELDEIAEKYRNPKERTSSGLWKLSIFYYGFNGFTGTRFKDESYWDDLKNKVDKWIKQNPNSPTAHIAKGIILKGYAWKFRGGTWAHNVPKDAWKPFKDNLIIAEQHMVNSGGIASIDPHWYEVFARIKTGLGEDSESFKKFIDEGLDKYPNYYQLYFAAIDYLAPKWHGDKLEIEFFANKAVERTRISEGMGLYARIYWYASQTQYDERLFSESNVVWSKMREGIFDVIATHPDSWNIQNFAFFSCLARDQDTTRALLDKMKTPMIMKAWKKQEYYEYCKKHAYASPNKQIQPTAISSS
ncbi:MAG: DUF4034 domain-containing protein [Neptuniibacter sp.]